jgi:hypothetical protein
MGPIAGPVHTPLVGQVPMIPLTGPSHMVPTGGGHAGPVHDWGTHGPLTTMTGFESHQVCGDHSLQEHPTS